MKEWCAMKYENYEGPIEELVRMKIKEIEAKENIRVLHVIESGSRAWGLASPDSDYDVRFIYVRDRNFYLSLRENKDFIDWELNEVLDINGWDIKKVLQHFHKSNATLFEWSNSPVVYYTTDEWKKLYDELFDSVLEEDMKPVIADLLAKKVQMSESDKAPKIDKVNQYVEEKLIYYKNLLEGMDDDRNPDWEPLEEVFKKVIGE